MKIKAFDRLCNEAYEDFDSWMNDFIRDKQFIQIQTNDALTGDFVTYTPTVLYEEN